MNPESQLEAAVCFVAANVSDPKLRTQFLDEACAGDMRLREAVETMLLAHADAEKFFAQGRAAVDAPELDAQASAVIHESSSIINMEEMADEQIGSWVGRYKLFQKIGEGGCGTVYMAEQKEPVRRQVALKVIKLGMDTKSVIARFEAERQALAMMDHPNIARVLDAGATETGRPFFVMELVRGTRITKYCDENNLDNTQRLQLFIQICRAIQHAHQKGVIHRDIKPSNILVTLHDGVPVPKVIDFGIAKATEGRLADNTMFTAVEQFVGTPAYMSPEQAEITGLDVDTRSDIYSLGVLLYELLTGRTPFDSKTLTQSGLDEMRRTLREQEPQLPSTMITSLRRTELMLTARHRHAEPPKLISQLKGDLDWIVMKALEKDRNRRYETANGLAMDIQRYLDSEPVMARPPSRIYRLQKLVRRNKIVFVATGAVALALMIGLGTSTWLFLRERETSRREARLLEESEDRATITKVLMLVSQNKYDKADEYLDGVKNILANSSLDNAFALRSVAEWMALQGHWQQAVKRYSMLINADKLESSSQIGLDYEAYAVSLAEFTDRNAYENFWNLAVTNCNLTPNESVYISCLLFPLDKMQILKLKPTADYFEKRPARPIINRINQWTFMPIALWKYRCGDYGAAIEWSQRGLAQKAKFQSCDTDLHLILAMAYFQSSQISEACSELDIGSQTVKVKFSSGIDHGTSGTGYWFDWYIAQHLQQEALALINNNHAD
jgi:serine/threonine protein kinase